MQGPGNPNRCNRLWPVEPAANSDSKARGLGSTGLAQSKEEAREKCRGALPRESKAHCSESQNNCKCTPATHGTDSRAVCSSVSLQDPYLHVQGCKGPESLVSLHQAKHSKAQVEHPCTNKISRSSKPSLNNSGLLKKAS